jgi:hypothetical protein
MHNSTQTKRKKELAIIAVVTIIFVATIGKSSLTFFTPTSVGTVVKVDPSQIEYSTNSTGQQFTIAVKIINVTRLYGFDIKFRWNTTFLDYVSHSVRVPKNTCPDGLLWNPILLVRNEVNQSAGTIWIAYSSRYPAPSFNGTGTAFTLTLKVKYHPVEPEPTANIALEIYETELVDSTAKLILHTRENGIVILHALSTPHDIAVTGITLSETVIHQGYSLNINVTVLNQGIYTETFNVTVYANTAVIDTRTSIVLNSKTSTTITFTWNTAGVALGNHRIKAEASIVPEETDTADNTFIDGTISIIPNYHDIAITDVRTSCNFAYSGEKVSIIVDVWNRGYFPETFNVATYADKNSTTIGDEITIGTQPLSLPSQSLTTLTFTWNTTGILSGNYTISSEASKVAEEADLTNNLYVNGKIEIFLSIPCYDINITSPTYIELNPSIFQFDWTVTALEVSLGNMTIDSTGYEGLLRVLGSTNGTIHLRIDQPQLEHANYYLPQNDSIKVPLWILFNPGTYSGTYELQLTVCGVHRLKITINIVSIWVCSNGVYSVAGGTATFNWTVTGGSWVYLEAQSKLPLGWSFNVDPPIGTLFETPHQIIVNITAAPDAKEGDIGSVTLRAYKNGTNTLIWQYTFFASVDNKPPTIEAIQPPALTFTGDLLFNTTVKDPSGIESVQFYYSVNSSPWNNQTMQWDSGDTFNSTSYTSVILHVADNSTIKYYIVATDWLRNQTQSDIRTAVIKYDLAITQAKISKTIIGQGFVTQITVTVANQGTMQSTSPNIVIYANTTIIHTQSLPLLTNGTATTITFNWNTTNVPKGNYRIAAVVIPILGETDTSDNTFADGIVRIGVKGDLNGDNKCNLLDLVLEARKFGAQKGDPHSPPAPKYDSNYDFNDDNKINLLDLVKVARYFGTTDP